MVFQPGAEIWKLLQIGLYGINLRTHIFHTFWETKTYMCSLEIYAIFFRRQYSITSWLVLDMISDIILGRDSVPGRQGQTSLLLRVRDFLIFFQVFSLIFFCDFSSFSRSHPQLISAFLTCLFFFSKRSMVFPWRAGV